MSAIRETAAEVAALIPRYSWELMDEDQRDALFDKVIVPRYMKDTKDGVTLGPKWWGKTLGTTDHAVRGRVRRREQGKPPPSAAPTESQMGQIRGAKAAIRAHPELARKLLDDGKVNDAVTDAVLRGTGRTGPRPDPTHHVRRDLHLDDLLGKVGLSIERATRELPDYSPGDDDIKDEANDIANKCEVFATFLRDWAQGYDIADEVSAFLERGET